MDIRIKHGDRLDIRRYVTSAVCPACGVDFRDRIRCISHLSDRRRPACADYVRQFVPAMSDSEVLRLDTKDRVLRREARRKGHTHHIALLPARRPDGSVTGRVSA